MDFDEYWRNGCFGEYHDIYAKNLAEQFYNAGQQSKQAEIDALKAKIEEIEKWAEFHIEDYNLSESDSEHDRGWFNAACQVFKSLKRD